MRATVSSKSWIALLALTAATGIGAANAQSELTTTHHDITAIVRPETQSIDVTDRWTIPGALVTDDMTFTLNAALKAKSETNGIKLELVKANAPGEDVGMDREEQNGGSLVTVNVYKLNGVKAGQETTVDLSYAGKIDTPIAAVGEEYARGFSQTPGLIEQRGAYLAGSTMWTPQIDGALITYKMTVDLPKEWKSVSQGKRLDSAAKGKRHVDVWEVTTPTEEAHLIAAPFSEYTRDIGGGVIAQAFLRSPDDALAERYLEVTGQYKQMYDAMIGPYPYAKFALVENFWETGYGMPSFTLLGEQVIRFPFILHSSYPHELLHNWWGNGVFVDFASGNWCEGLTAYLADHLVSEQNGKGDLHRRDILLRISDFVTPENDFPLTAFRSRYNPVTEAIGYGKTAIVFDMLRQRVGDKTFIAGLQKFYRDNSFRNASWGDIRTAFEAVSKQDLAAFFTQWVEHDGVPDLKLENADTKGKSITITVAQTQPGPALAMDVPIALYAGGKAIRQTLKFDGSASSLTQTFDLPAKAERVEIDPQFNVYRRLSPFEVPTSLSKAFGAEKSMIVLPSTDEAARYDSLVKSWARSGLEVVKDADISDLPADRAVWVLGTTNKLIPVVNAALKAEGATLDAAGAMLDGTKFASADSSLVIAARHPKAPASAVVFVSATTPAAAEGLARKLPHYGKYSWLAFSGDEPENTGKGEWTPRNTPLARDLAANVKPVVLTQRPALAELPSLIDAERMKSDVTWLADPAREGRGVGSAGLEASADYITKRFSELGLAPLGKDYAQSFTMKGPGGKDVAVKNIVGVLPGTNPAYAGQSVIVSAHYDHLGLGWPDVRAGDEGKIHPGADDNASGVAAMMELARLLQDYKPERSIVFIAFTGEEAGLIGSKHYVGAAKAGGFPYPLDKTMVVLNMDTVGRLEGGKIRIFGGETARDLPFVFQGVGFTTGTGIEIIPKDMGGSDQKAFAEAGVPGVQVFASTAADYHHPSDTADKIDVAGLVKVVEAVKEAATYFAGRPEPMPFAGSTAEAAATQANAGESGARRVSTGLVPDMAFAGKGVRAGSVTDGSGAAAAGLKTGDVVISLAEHKVGDLRELSDALKTFTPGQVIDVVYLRDGKEAKTSMTLGAR
ncbi:MAG: M20/M25/M40 family metallo-hydrolase [Rhodobacteraceae bacterium]|nr:M20/M25/M40 family metallo-hydrolase [Paracoccaceae bacterium]